MSWQKGCPVIVYRNTLQGQQELESFLSEAKDNAIENRKGGCFCMCVFCFVLLNTTSLRVKGQTIKTIYCIVEEYCLLGNTIKGGTVGLYSNEKEGSVAEKTHNPNSLKTPLES